jgi:GntR family transcriptional regulator
MLLNVDPRDERPLYIQIMDEVRRALVTGALRAEDPLPSVRDLASDLAINPRTVRQAYGELEREGVVYVKRGLGTFVAADSQARSEERRALGRSVAKRALVEARRNGLGAEEFIAMIREVAEEEAQRVAGEDTLDGDA